MLPEVDGLLCAPELAIMEPDDENLSLPGFVIPGVIGLLLLLPSSSGSRALFNNNQLPLIQPYSHHITVQLWVFQIKVAQQERSGVTISVDFRAHLVSCFVLKTISCH